jgi:hypothetical protein
MHVSLNNPLIINESIEKIKLPLNLRHEFVILCVISLLKLESTKNKNVISLLKWIIFYECVHNEFFMRLSVFVNKFWFKNHDSNLLKKTCFFFQNKKKKNMNKEREFWLKNVVISP